MLTLDQHHFAKLTPAVFDRRQLSGHPPLEVVEPGAVPLARRKFLLAAGAALFANESLAATGPLTFSPEDTPAEPLRHGPVQRPLSKGEIPPDFWERPRELWLRRHRTSENVRLVYWADGQLQSEGYWKACAILRDKSQNVMTAVDPVLLDVLRGIHGYYEAWNWKEAIVITSGYRTLKTNNTLSREGAAKNSMHLYGKAVDLFVPGIPPAHVATLGRYLQQGGVGFYPSRGFTHLDTGRLRSWRG